MRKPTVYVLLACIVVMVVFFIVVERSDVGRSADGCMIYETAGVQLVKN